MKRKSWDTSVKHYIRLGLIGELPLTYQNKIPKSNYYRWKNEPEDKYEGCEVAAYIKQEIELIKSIGQSSRLRKINKTYIQLSKLYKTIAVEKKGLKKCLKLHKELIINTIENCKSVVSIDDALEMFSISRSTYQNYKAQVIYKCNASYFKWCVKRFPNQLLPKEVETIKSYLTRPEYQFWCKASVYLKAIRDKNLSCSLSTFYNYANLLGFKSSPRKHKENNYNPVTTSKPNELWCADVTIFKTADSVKHYIHILMDHYSKLILGYKIEKHNSGKAIRQLLNEAYIKHKPHRIKFLTDAGTENINQYVSSFLNGLPISTKHIIAQKDVVFSNSMIERFNRVLKHEYLYPQLINTSNQLYNILPINIENYNTTRPQMKLGGNTPHEVFKGIEINLNNYKTQFTTHKKLRIKTNQQNKCVICE